MRTRRRSTTFLLVWILALSGSGAWLSGQLVKQHANLWGSEAATTGFFGRMCQAAERAGLSCAGTTQGRWSEIAVPVPTLSGGFNVGVRTATVPVAFLSLAYFVFMGTWFAFVGRPRAQGYAWHRIPLVLASCGAMVSLLYVGLMVFRIAPGCLWCIGVHLINFLLLHAVWRLCTRVPDQEVLASPAEMARTILTSREVTSVIAFSLILIVGLWAYRRERLALQDQYYRLLPYHHLVQTLRDDPEFLLREYYAQPQRQIPARPGDSIPEGQPHLVVFTDFQCSACYCNSVAVRRRIPRAFNGQLAVSIRHFPLCCTCNHSVEGEPHVNACEAAYAAEAARLQGGQEAFQKMYTKLFQNGSRLSREMYRELATQIGLDAAQLMRDMDDQTVRQIVADDVALANELGVTGTPTMFLDGRLITELCQGDVFWKTVAADLGISPMGDPQPVVANYESVAANPADKEPQP